MSHLIALPFVLPLLAGAVLVALGERARASRWVTGLASILGLVVAALLLRQVHDSPISYQLGSWPWPVGIELYADRTSAALVLLSAVVAAVATLPAVGYDAGRGRHFLALLQFQLAGINGSFLAGDLFNLFVCFEILLISSYALLVHGHERPPRAAIVYTVLNLTGSTLFLIGVALVYGATGTLNLADVTARLADLPADTRGFGLAGAWLLALVFALKSALLPLGLWLPSTYAVASPTVAAIFMLLTKVGVYALMRLYGPWLDSSAPLASVGQALGVAAAASALVGALLALASRSLRQLAGSLVLVSVATALMALSAGGERAAAAALFYTLHSTLAAASLFLVAACVARLRGKAGDDLTTSPPVTWRGGLVLLYFGIAVLVAGLPPLSGFIGKVGALEVLARAPNGAALVGVLLTASLLGLIATVRAGNAVFLRSPAEASRAPAGSGARSTGGAAALMFGLSVLLTVFAGPIREWVDVAGTQIGSPRQLRSLSQAELLEEPRP